MEFDSFKDKLFERSKMLGFDNCELYNLSGLSFLLNIPTGDEFSSKRGVAFRGTIGNKTGTAYTENISEDGINFILDSARENASLSNDAPVYFCRPGLSYPTIDNQSKELLNVADLNTKRNEFCQEIEKYPTLAKTTGVLHSLSVTTRIVNTLGLDIENTANYIYCSYFPIAERDGELTRSLNYRGGSRLSDIDVPVMVEEACNRADRYFDVSPVKTGRYNILFANNTASYMVQGFSVFFSADSVNKGLSLWKNKLGRQVANPVVTVVDDPLDVRGVFTRPFDVEGYPAKRIVLIENGVLKSYLYNAATAEKSKDATPGNTWRLDFYYEPAIFPSNMYLAPGKKSVGELLQELGDGLVVTDMTAYFHGAGVNAISGDYSMPVTGFVVKNGKIDRPFDGVTVAGNLYEMIKKITVVGNDFIYGLPTSFRPGAPMGYGCYGSPSMIVSDISVGGV